jgi:hypothetical protein
MPSLISAEFQIDPLDAAKPVAAISKGIVFTACIVQSPCKWAFPLFLRPTCGRLIGLAKCKGD